MKWRLIILMQLNLCMKILGIDPGIADTGYGVVADNGGQLKCLIYGSIKTEAKDPLAKRLVILADALEAVIKQQQPQAAAIEQLFFAKNVKTAMAVGQARGVALLICQQSGLPLSEFTPMQVKQAVAGYGAADKRQIQRMTQIILKLKSIPEPDDAADALAVAICGLNSAKFQLDKMSKKV